MEIPFKEKFSQELIIKKSEIMPGIYLGNTLTTPQDNKVKVLLMNTLDTDQELSTNDIEVGWEDLDDYNVLQAEETNNLLKNRLERLESLLELRHCNQEERNSILNICRTYNNLFLLEGDYLTYTDAIEHQIITEEGKPPLYIRPYRLPDSSKQEIHKQVNEMLQDKVVQQSFSPWNSPLLLVPKKAGPDGTKRWRVVVDFRALNKITVGDAYPLPNITDILDQLGKAKYFSTLDLASGFHQIRMDNRDKAKTAFSTPFGHYEYNRMPFGLKNAPATFQRLMNNVLMGLQGIECFVYVDDIVIYGYDLNDHNSRLTRIFERLQRHNLKIQPEKCHFIRKELTYLGHVISKEGIKPDPEKTKAVKTFPTPKKQKDVKSFLGFVGYYRKFIPNFAELAKPLSKLLRKNVPFHWDAFCDEAFTTLKRKVITPPILAYPDFNMEFIITTDASNIALGAVLSQGTIGQDKPIAFASRTLNDAETRYTTSEKELLAIVFALAQFRPYVYGRKFTIVTDHSSLQWLIGRKDPTSRLMRWRILLEEYEYTIVHRKGKQNANADALSRITPTTPVDPIKNNILVTTRSKAKLAEDVATQSYKDSINLVWQEQTGSIYTKKKLGLRIIILPLIDSAEEENLAGRIPNFTKPEVGEITFHEQDGLCAITLPLPFRNPSDQETAKSSLIDLKKIFEDRNFNSIGILLPLVENESKVALNNLLKETFAHLNVTMYVFSNKKKLLTDPNEIQQLLAEYHNSPFGGHQGATRTINRLKQKYYWRTMTADVTAYIRKCASCQINKSGRNPRIPMKITTTSSKPFERVALDIVGPLPVSYNGNKYLLTFQDDLTKFSGAYALASAETKDVARIFVENIVCQHGIPSSLLTDRGANFLSALFKDICSLLKMRKLNTAPYHPQTNGALERSHRTLVEYLRHYVNQDPLTWDTWIPYAMFVYNTTPHSNTGYTPHELLYGFPAEIPSSLRQNPESTYNYDHYANELKMRLQHGYRTARGILIEKKEKSKAYYDQKVGRKKFNVGDKVLLKNHSRPNKLTSLWKGPYEILKILSEENTVLKIGKGTRIVHNNNIKPFVA